MSAALPTFVRTRELHDATVLKAPGLGRRLAALWTRPEDIGRTEGLNPIPVSKKEQLRAKRAAEPSFGGRPGADPECPGHIFASLGPIIVPSLVEACIGPADIAHSCLSCPVVPAGSLCSRGVRARGATVIPAWIGNSGNRRPAERRQPRRRLSQPDAAALQPCRADRRARRGYPPATNRRGPAGPRLMTSKQPRTGNDPWPN